MVNETLADSALVCPAASVARALIVWAPVVNAALARNVPSANAVTPGVRPCMWWKSTTSAISTLLSMLWPSNDPEL